VYTIRPTHALLKKLDRNAKSAESPPSTTALGDWFVRAHNFGRQRLLLCTSSRSLLTVLMPARDLRSVGERLRGAVGDLLFALGSPVDQVNREIEEMRTFVFNSSNNRQVIGSMTDMAFMADAHLQHGSSPDHLVVVGMKLARSPCSPLDYDSPQRVALKLLRTSAS